MSKPKFLELRTHQVNWGPHVQLTIYSAPSTADDEIVSRQVFLHAPLVFPELTMDIERMDTVAGCVAWIRGQVEVALWSARENLRVVGEAIADQDKIHERTQTVTSWSRRAEVIR